MPKRISIQTFTRLVLVAVLLLEIYLAYFLLYSKLSPQPEAIVSNNIVRIDRTSLNAVTLFLDGLESFQPESLNLANPNPFKYSQ